MSEDIQSQEVEEIIEVEPEVQETLDEINQVTYDAPAAVEEVVDYQLSEDLEKAVVETIDPLDNSDGSEAFAADLRGGVDTASSETETASSERAVPDSMENTAPSAGITTNTSNSMGEGQVVSSVSGAMDKITDISDSIDSALDELQEMGEDLSQKRDELQSARDQDQSAKSEGQTVAQSQAVESDVVGPDGVDHDALMAGLGVETGEEWEPVDKNGDSTKETQVSEMAAEFREEIAEVSKDQTETTDKATVNDLLNEMAIEGGKIQDSPADDGRESDNKTDSTAKDTPLSEMTTDFREADESPPADNVIDFSGIAASDVSDQSDTSDSSGEDDGSGHPGTDSDSSGAGIDNKMGVQSGLRVVLQQTRTKTSTGQSFSDVAAEGLSKAADAVMSAGQLAAPYIPGGSVVSAAISGVGQQKDDAGDLQSSSGNGGSADDDGGQTESGTESTTEIEGEEINIDQIDLTALEDQWSEYIEDAASGDIPMDVNTLVQYVLREAYMENTKDLQFYAQKVKFFNKMKEKIRDHLTDIRETHNLQLEDTLETTMESTIAGLIGEVEGAGGSSQSGQAVSETNQNGESSTPVEELEYPVSLAGSIMVGVVEAKTTIIPETGVPTPVIESSLEIDPEGQESTDENNKIQEALDELMLEKKEVQKLIEKMLSDLNIIENAIANNTWVHSSGSFGAEGTTTYPVVEQQPDGSFILVAAGGKMSLEEQKKIPGIMQQEMQKLYDAIAEIEAEIANLEASAEE